MNNQRGITVSSTIGMIIEDIIDDRIREKIVYTESQGGGQKGCSTCDHVFNLRSLISLAMKKKQKLFLTFFDVKKACDHADMNDMLSIIWKKGVKGKVWRLVRELNENLTARVKTKHGLTRKINREMGGKQGGRLMPTIFAKMTDMVEEEAQRREDIGISINGKK
jgi:hypothetical protein